MFPSLLPTSPPCLSIPALLLMSSHLLLIHSIPVSPKRIQTCGFDELKLSLSFSVPFFFLSLPHSVPESLPPFCPNRFATETHTSECTCINTTHIHYLVLLVSHCLLCSPVMCLMVMWSVLCCSLALFRSFLVQSSDHLLQLQLKSCVIILW